MSKPICNKAFDFSYVLKKAAQIEKVITKDLGKRGIKKLLQENQGDLAGLALSIAQSNSPRILIITGFFIPYGDRPAAETDGPIGAALLFLFFKELGIPCYLLTDNLCKKALAAVLQVCGGSEYLITLSKNDFQQTEIASLWNKLNRKILGGFSHLISIERPAKGIDGEYYNMRGKSISQYVVPLDELFQYAAKRGVISAAIGDGGNEIGMGKIKRQTIVANLNYGEIIASTVSCRYLIVSGVSNWGAMGLIVMLGSLRSDMVLAAAKIFTKARHLSLLSAAVAKGGAIDGVTYRQALTVDGLELQKQEEVIVQLIAILPKNFY